MEMWAKIGTDGDLIVSIKRAFKSIKTSNQNEMWKKASVPFSTGSKQYAWKKNSAKENISFCLFICLLRISFSFISEWLLWIVKRYAVVIKFNCSTSIHYYLLFHTFKNLFFFSICQCTMEMLSAQSPRTQWQIEYRRIEANM